MSTDTSFRFSAFESPALPPMDTGVPLPGAEPGGQVLERLYRVAIALQTSWGREERLAAFTRGVQEVVGFDRISVLLATPDGTGLELVRSRGEKGVLPPAILPLSRAAGPLYQAFQSRRPIAVLGDEDLGRILPLDAGYRTHPSFRTRRFVAAPLVVGARTIGVACADNKPSRRPISPSSIEPFTLLCQLLATALEETRLHQETRAREQETTLLCTGLGLLTQASRALYRTLDVDAMLKGALDELAQAFGASAVFVDLFSPAGEIDRRIGHWSAEAHGRDASPENEGVSQLIWHTRIPLVLRDMTERPDVVHPAHLHHGVKSLAAFPIIDREQHLLGVLFLCYQLPQRFPDSEMYLLAAYADQLGIALEDAQLYDEAERRRHESEVLSDLGRTLNASLDLGMVLQRVVEAAKELCGNDLAVIALRDGRSGAMVFRHWLGARTPRPAPLCVEKGKGAGGHVLATGRPFRTNDCAGDPRVSRDDAGIVRDEGVRAATVVPIRIDERVEGLLYVGNRSLRPLTDQDEAVLVRLADHAAIAIKNARLYEEAACRRHEAEELARLARTLTESLDSSELGQRIVEGLVPAFRARSAALRLLRPDGAWVAVCTAGPGQAHSGTGHGLPAGIGISARVVASNGPVQCPDILDDLAVVLPDEMRERIAASGDRAFLAVPLRLKGEILGVLWVADEAGRVFSESEVALLQTFADQAALALENAELYRRAADRAQKLTALSGLTRLITSASDRQEVFHAVSRAAVLLLGATMARVWVDDPTAHALEAQGTAGIDPALEGLMTDLRAIPYGQGVVSEVFATRKAVYIRDIQEDARWLNQRLVKEVGLHAYAGLPLIAQGRPVGVLSILFDAPRQVSPEEQDLMNLLADQAAIAIRNTHLFAQEQEARVAAEASGRRFRDLVENLDAVIWEADATTGQVSFVSRRVETVLGYPVEQWLTEPECWASHLHPDDRERALTARRTALAEGRPYDVVYRFLAADGRVVWLRTRVHVALDAAGAARQLRGVTVDITEGKRLQEELVQAEKLATLGELIAGIAHELNNPLAALTGHAQLLRIEQKDTPAAARAERILEAAQRTSRVVQNFLSFARKHRSEKVPVSMNDLITKTRELLAYQLRVNNIHVQTDLAPALPSIAGDPHQLQQVLLNLFNNSAQAMAGAGGAGILRVATTLDRDAATLRVAIADDGPGISPENLSRIFEPFFTTKPAGEGTGLGLPIAQGIVTEHGGTLVAESESGQGATFIVTLPVPQGQLTSPPAAGTRTVPKGLRILAVDDEATLRELMMDAFTEAGNQVETAVDGNEALDILARSPVDVLLLDVRMPGMSGPELWAEINRTNPGLARRTVFCTGSVVGEKTRAFLDATGCPTVAKPFELEHLFDAVARAARKEDVNEQWVDTQDDSNARR